MDVTTDVLPRWFELRKFARFLEELRTAIGGEPAFVKASQAQSEAENRPVAALEHHFELVFQGIVELLSVLLREDGIRERDADKILQQANQRILPATVVGALQRVRQSRNTVQHGHSLTAPERSWRAIDIFAPLIPQVEAELRKAFRAHGVELPI
jgi:hypothetical protein